MRMRRTALVVVIGVAAVSRTAFAHDGPPFPIVSDRLAGPYVVSIWTDPDSTDDGSAGGQFWVVLGRADKAGSPPAQTRAAVTIRPVGREGPLVSAQTSPVRDVTNQFAALVMDHEGRFAVHVSVDGPLGAAAVDGEVEATYNLRPPLFMVAIYVLPFVLAGLLWVKLLLRRRGHPRH